MQKGSKLPAASIAEIEANLVMRAQQGDRNAFGELVRQHHPGVVKIVYRMCGDSQLAEDAAQEAFLKAWLRLPSLRSGSSLRNWLYRIAVNSAIDVLRSRESASITIEGLTLADPQANPEAVLLDREQRMIVQRAILGLNEASRAVLVLREYGDLSYQEIASVLEIPTGTVMSRLNYARKRLRESLGILYGEQA